MTTRSRILLFCLTLLMILSGSGVGDAFGTPELRDGSRVHLPEAHGQGIDHAAPSAVLPIPVVLPPVQADNRLADEDETAPQDVRHGDTTPSVRPPLSRTVRAAAPSLSLLYLLCVLRC